MNLRILKTGLVLKTLKKVLHLDQVIIKLEILLKSIRVLQYLEVNITNRIVRTLRSKIWHQGTIKSMSNKSEGKISFAR